MAREVVTGFFLNRFKTLRLTPGLRLPSVASRAIKLAMSRLFSSLLVFVFLLGQLALVTHVYEAHDSDTLCELCLTQSHQDHGLASSPSSWSLNSSYALVTETYQQDFSIPHIAHYAVRAPPVLL